MTQAELTQELASEGLRLAANDPASTPGLCEAGWTYTYITDEGERVTIWVTDANEKENEKC